MNRKKSNLILLISFMLMVLVFAIVTIKIASSTYDKKVAEEKITEPDFYAMSEFCADNSAAVMKALKAESGEKLKSLMIDSKGIEDVLKYASWSDASIADAVSLGAGSFSAAPDKDGKMDISERFVIPVGEQKYVLYIETLTSRHGMKNEGVSVIAVTTYDHFDQLDSVWNGEADDSSAVAGKTFVKNK